MPYHSSNKKYSQTDSPVGPMAQIPTLRTYSVHHIQTADQIFTPNKKKTTLVPVSIGCTGFMCRVIRYLRINTEFSCKSRSCIYPVKFMLHVDVWGWLCMLLAAAGSQMDVDSCTCTYALYKNTKYIIIDIQLQVCPDLLRICHIQWCSTE